MTKTDFTVADKSTGRRRIGRIFVCPFSALDTTVAGCNASYLLTCLQDDLLVETPQAIKPHDHLRLHVHDIAEALPGYVAPSEEHIGRLIEFAQRWGGEGPMVVHCWAGISRSTAAAFTALCAINPDTPEQLIAGRLRLASPTAYPNRLMIRLADEALGRGGRMMDAIEEIGRGVPAHEARPFSLPADIS
jgi:predicted protein tyrosine phosphatase